ncbi:keratin, type I cytoskeletal 18-like isoform X2 [Rana temporaria]|uniref:keratin, type I cytoskeletal 18-like isoform X2 n=1 Tax=Rana temporaria TaxID=8407 RepID=UPI001AAD4E0D|nr:keratin, type I cytoskeletal 18-like isoform X2 [Rana temporaria]XP_040214146.1 keratin, type I cytoskeletal 18-like isoform X2 [Rana temporaria]
MSFQMSSGAPSWRSSASSQTGESRLSGSRLQALRSGMDLPSLRSSMDSSLLTMRSSMDSLLQNNHQEAMQGLNERLAGYLQRVRGLEEENRKLQEEIDERSAQKSSVARDWDTYQAPLHQLRKQVEDLNMDNAKLLLQIDNARLAADDFKVKLEAEQAICDGVQKDTQGLRKMIDDTNFQRMKLEAEVEALREELAHLTRDHKEEVAALQALIANNDVKVEVDAPKKGDLNDSIAQIRSQYEKMAEQNRLEAENAYKTKFDALSQEANSNTKALEQAKNEVADLRRQLQALEMEHQTLQKTVDSLDHVLKDTEDHYASQLMELNRMLARLQDELAACRSDIERQVRDYDALLNLKSKLENEIHDYRTLLEGVTDKDGPETPGQGGK